MSAAIRNAKVCWLVPLLLAVACFPACNRSGAAGAAKAASAADRKLPFHSYADTEVSASQAHPSPAEASDGLPFGSHSHLRVLPSGTLITVRLEHPLNSAEVNAGDAFTALVAEPVTIDGDTLVARDTAVAGAIESAQESMAQRGTGYIRLTLSAITVDGKRLPLQTSSLFARGTPPPPAGSSRGEASPGGIRLSPGRRLTFRLTVPASLDPQNSVATGQYSALNSD